jgi:hypothetical protein
VRRWLAVAALALANGAAPLAHAADADAVIDPLADFLGRSKPTLDIRARWGNADQTHLSGSNALTLRIRLGLLSPDVRVDSLGSVFEGIDGAFKAFIEYEGTEVGSKSSYFVPFVQGTPGKTVIADPASHELNRAWLQYTGYDSQAKYGRQRISLDNARFVGNIPWRQNEQTFDAVRFTNRSIENLKLDYSYLWKVRRIFGSKSSQSDPTGDFDSRTHLAHATFTGISNTKLKAYAYFMDLENGATKAPGNKAYGASIAGAIPVDDFRLGYYGEWARQSDHGDNPTSYHSTYYHVKLWVGYEGYKLGGGWEQLGEDSGIGFQTPIGTNHKFNGWADVFLSTPATGLVDRYAWVDIPLPFEFDFKAVAHRFDPDSSSGKFGEEYDFLLIKKLPWGLVALMKLAFYKSDISTHLDDPGVPGPGDNVTRFSVELSYKYN